MNPYLMKYLPQLEEMFKLYRVKRAYAFGSVVGDDFSPSSDVDILLSMDDNLEPLEYGKNYLALWDELEKLFQRKVDLLTEKYVTNPYLLTSLNKTKVQIYG